MPPRSRELSPPVAVAGPRPPLVADLSYWLVSSLVAASSICFGGAAKEARASEIVRLFIIFGEMALRSLRSILMA